MKSMVAVNEQQHEIRLDSIHIYIYWEAFCLLVYFFIHQWGKLSLGEQPLLYEAIRR